MNRIPVVAWSGPALTAKLFLPILLLVFVELFAAPRDDHWTGTWTLLAVSPIAGLAIWLFATIVELRPTEGGVRYRKWIHWKFMPLTEIADVARVFPCFAAVIPHDGRKLYFFPDAETTQYLRALSDSGDVGLGGVDRRKRTPWQIQIRVFAFGVGLGLLARYLTHPLADHNAESPNVFVRVELRYMPILVGSSIVYLIMTVAGQRLRGSDLYISLVLIGLGSVYVCEVFFGILRGN